jgi:hypothetical protein
MPTRNGLAGIHERRTVMLAHRKLLVLIVVILGFRVKLIVYR